VLLKATNPPEMNLRFPGQYADEETGSFYNYFRMYDPRHGRYRRSDPIGLAGGLNTFLYAEANPLSFIDPFGLASDGHHWVIGPIRNDPNLSSAAADVFKNARTGPVPGGHNFGDGHAAYNKGVNDLWKDYLAKTKCDPTKMTKAQAEDFVSRVKTSNDPRVRNFNRRIYEKFIRDGFRRMPPRSVE
jgi:RHS repeat-associated protein